MVFPPARHGKTEARMELYRFAVPLAVVTGILLVLTALSGVLKLKFGVHWIKLHWHIYLAYATLAFGTLHVIIVLYYSL